MKENNFSVIVRFKIVKKGQITFMIKVIVFFHISIADCNTILVDM